MVIRGSEPTMRDVAALAGVGLMTVSRVVNGVDTVSEDLRVRVLDAIEKLDYRHNQNASRMRSLNAQGGTIALCVENVDNPFSSGVQRGLEDAVRSHGYLVFSASSDGNAETERRLIEAFCQRQVDGLVVLPVGQDHSFLTSRIKRGLGVVYVDRPARALPADLVMTEHEQGAFTGVDHLLKRGHRRVAFVGNIDEFPVSERFTGYRRALSSHGIELDMDLVAAGARSMDDARKLVRSLLESEHRPTALFTSVDLLSMGARLALHELGLEGTIAQVGFDDFQMAEALEPGLTVYKQDPIAIGRECGELLLDRLSSANAPSARRVVIPGLLIPRGSGELVGRT